MVSPQGPDRGLPRSVSVLRVPKVGAICVRFLGSYTGAILHYLKDGSIPCDGDGACPATLHKTKSIWRGWAPVEQFERSTGKWWPEVLEITEYLEEQLHGRALRGETWALGRYVQSKKKGKVWGQYLEQAEPEGLRPAFDILPILLRLFHVLSIRLGVSNPVPRRLFMQPAEGETPQALIDGNEGGETPLPSMDRATFLDLLKQSGFDLGKGSTNGATNGARGGHHG